MNIILHSISSENNTTTTILVDINIIPLAIRSFLIEKNERFEVF